MTPRIPAAFIAAAALALLTACGGGGGGGGSSSSSSSSGGGGSSGGGVGTFTVSATSVSVTATRLGITPSDVIVTAHNTDTRTAVVGAAYKAGVVPPTWLNVGLIQRGADYDFNFDVNPTGMSLDFGTYTTTVTVGAVDAAGNVLHSQDISVTLTIRDGLRFTSTGAVVDGRAGDSGSFATRTFTVIGPAAGQWTATSNASWLHVPAGTQTGPGDFVVTMDASALASGSHDATITIVNNADSTDRAMTHAIFNLLPSCPYLAPFNTGGRLGGNSGLDQAPVDFAFAIGTGTNAFPWSVSAPSWVHFDVTSGLASSAYTTLHVSADLSQLVPGDYSAIMNLTSTVNGQPCLNEIPVQARVEFDRLLVSSTGVAFSKFPGRAVLTRALQVSDTRADGDIAWNAVDDAAWLTVTASGTTAGADGGTLQLTADTTGLAPGQYYAMVTISPASSGRVQNDEHVRVGLTIRAANPPASITIPHSMGPMIANPVDPEFYSTNGLGSFDVYDVYSGALLRSYPGLGATYHFAVSGDGRSVFRIVGDDVTAFDPQTGATQNTWAASYDSGAFTYARPDAHPVLIVGGSTIVDLGDNSIRSDYFLRGDKVALSANHRMLYGVSHFDGYDTIYAQRMRYSSFADPRVVLGVVAQYQASDDDSYNDVGASQVSNRVFGSRSGVGRQVDVLDGLTMTLQSPLTFQSPELPYFAATSWNGRVAVMTSHPTAGTIVAIYNDAGVPLSSWNAGAGGLFIEEKTVIFAGDGTRLMTGTDTEGRIHAVN